MQWIKVDNYDEMCELAASTMFGLLSERAAERKPFNLGMATGNTMIGVYDRLAARLNKAGTDMSRVSTFNLDEYVGDDGRDVPETHPLSYKKYMSEKFFSKLSPSLGFDKARMFFPDAENPSGYDRLIDRSGGIDFQLLGVGFNGHIAFNEPVSEREISADKFSKIPSRVLDLDSLTIATNAKLTAANDMAMVPKKAVTMGMESILNAREIMLLACFAEQTAPLGKIKTGRITPENPSSFLLGHKTCSVVYTTDKIKL